MYVLFKRSGHNAGCVSIMAAFIFAILASIAPHPVFADPDEEDPPIAIQMYVPYAPGIEHCYTAYRVIATRVSRATYFRGSEDSVEASFKNHGSHKIAQSAVSYTDSRNMHRDDVFVLTDFAVTAERTLDEYDAMFLNRFVSRHREIRAGDIALFFYETPHTVVGFVSDMNPFSGSSSYEKNGTFSHVILDRNVIERYSPDFSPEKLLPRYSAQGPDFKRDVERITSDGVLVLKDSYPEMIGWWQLYSQEGFKSLKEKALSFPSVGKTIADRKAIDSVLRNPDFLEAHGDEGWISSLDESTPVLTWPSEVLKDPVFFFNAEESLPSSPADAVWKSDEYIFKPKAEIYSIWQEAARSVAKQYDAETLVKWFSDGQDSQPTLTKQLDGMGIDISQTNLVKIIGNMRSHIPGVWGFPSSSSFATRVFSLRVMSPEVLGLWPFSGAWNIHFNDGLVSSPSVLSKSLDDSADVVSGGSRDFIEGVERTLSQTEGLSLPGFLQNAPFHDIWLPGDTHNKSIWKIWFDMNRDFYIDMAPYLSIRLGLVLWDAPEDSMSWEDSIERTKKSKEEIPPEHNWKNMIPSPDFSSVLSLGKIVPDSLRSFASRHDPLERNNASTRGTSKASSVTELNVKYFFGDADTADKLAELFPALGRGKQYPVQLPPKMSGEKMKVPAVKKSSAVPPVWGKF